MIEKVIKLYNYNNKMKFKVNILKDQNLNKMKNKARIVLIVWQNKK